VRPRRPGSKRFQRGQGGRTPARRPRPTPGPPTHEDLRPPTDEDWTVADDATIRRVSSPRPVGELADQILPAGWRERLRGSTLTDRWPDIVGADIARRSEPVRLAGRTLVVRVESQAWATQLRYLSEQIRHNAEEVLGRGQVREIRLTIGRLQGPGDQAP
jgi:predicted nucleic acid-binding Zn ribbon protein